MIRSFEVCHRAARHRSHVLTITPRLSLSTHAEPKNGKLNSGPTRKPATSSSPAPQVKKSNIPGAGVNIYTGEEIKPDADGKVSKAGGNAEEGLPFLPRPLGVKEPPRTEGPSWEERKAKLLSYDEKLKERKHIVKELATKGYWTDMNRLSDYGGKMWIAAPALIRDTAALYFPDISGTALEPRKTVHTTDMCKGNVSIVVILTTLMSESHIKSFVEPTLEAFSNNENFRYVQINLQENPLKSMLVSFFLSRMKSQVPAQYHATYLLSHQNMEYLHEPMGLLNKHVGYVYLVDHNVKIRWAGCGFARPEERRSLRACVQELLARLPSRPSESQKEKGVP